MQKHLHRVFMTVFLAASFSATAHADILLFQADIDGAQAANCSGTGSPATGTGTFTLDTATGQVDYDITVDVGSLLGPETASHVHGAAAACSPAGIVFSLPTGSPKVGSMVLSPGQVADMLAELYYVNVHSTVVPGGELRGQILQVAQVVPALSQWAALLTAVLLLALGTTRLSRRRAAA